MLVELLGLSLNMFQFRFDSILKPQFYQHLAMGNDGNYWILDMVAMLTKFCFLAL